MIRKSIVWSWIAVYLGSISLSLIGFVAHEIDHILDHTLELHNDAGDYDHHHLHAQETHRHAPIIEQMLESDSDDNEHENSPVQNEIQTRFANLEGVLNCSNYFQLYIEKESFSESHFLIPKQIFDQPITPPPRLKISKIAA